ncbi:hypothetical protein [uncultured Gilvimarinus sp.]|uniref:hypothetical protein n=1 Tax=uncultured Gilvimarinus sp. TaxID=1689143 RepID=UPI0030EDD958|tara:strand:- start:3133 stop:3618 length:486 start_codon:yes stop_codon:yes gene_type:complete
MNIDKEKIKLAACLLLWGALGSYFCQPLVHGNSEAINVIVTVFSILAGFLVAVITLVGDPKSLPSGGWQVARLGSDLTYNRLIRHKWLFKFYLITLFLIFSSILIKNKYPSIQVGLEYVYMFFASISCFLSFKLPRALIELQQERIEHEIEERRKKEGIND